MADAFDDSDGLLEASPVEWPVYVPQWNATSQMRDTLECSASCLANWEFEAKRPQVGERRSRHDWLGARGIPPDMKKHQRPHGKGLP